MANIDCEACGGPAAQLVDHVRDPELAGSELCGSCLRIERRRVLIDSRAGQMANMTDDEAAPLLRQLELAA